MVDCALKFTGMCHTLEEQEAGEGHRSHRGNMSRLSNLGKYTQGATFKLGCNKIAPTPRPIAEACKLLESPTQPPARPGSKSRTWGGTLKRPAIALLQAS